ncbi:unnamed protein product [Clonostachys byssicola]|uniref:Disease resistance R13L4/SHOC-2-like LRR domain-containing protein n=1 Tax=Clonostachys byssicola TaxID=160290 RepID=A0A9N9UG19_9HYPO|nr:unnamed protein product [Clonostachys byssicola]
MDPGSPVSLRSGRRQFPWTSKPRLNHRPSFNVLGSRSVPVSDDQAFELAVEAVRKAVETQQHAEKEPTLDTDINNGMTINLSGKKIGALTDSIIKVVPRDIQRLALTENMLSNIPLRLSTFSSLRYLNARDNCIKSFPPVIFLLPRLEILDLSVNKIQVLPEDISKLTSLRVLAIRENFLQEFPASIADMTLLQVLKVEGNPLNQKLRRILTSRQSSTKMASEPANLAEIAVTTRIKQYLKDSNPSTTIIHPLGELRYPPSPITDQPKHPSRSSRPGRFPVKVRESHSQPSNPPPSPIALHSKAFSQQSIAPRSPCLIPPTITEGGESPQRAARGLSIQTGSIYPSPRIKRPLWNQLQSPMTVERPRRVSFGAEPHRPAYQERTSDIANSGKRSILGALAMQPSPPLAGEPLLGMARTLYLSINQLHLPLQALASLASDVPNRRSALELTIEKATFDLNILGQLIQKHSVLSQQGLEEADRNIIGHTCADLINNYMAVCSQVVTNLDRLVDRGDPRFVRNLISLMYSSVMSFRGEFMPYFQSEASDYKRTVRPNRSLKAQMGLGIRQSPRHVTSRPPKPLTVTPPESETEPDAVSDRRREWEYVDLVQTVLQRSFRLVLDTLPSLNQQIRGSLSEILTQEPRPHMIDTYQLLYTSCSRMIEQASSLEKHLPALSGDCLNGRFGPICYEYVEAWTQLGALIKSSHPVVAFPPETMRAFQQIQRSVKEVTSLTMNPKPTPVESPTSPRSDVSMFSASTPITPMQASIGPAIEILSIHSP